MFSPFFYDDPFGYQPRMQRRRSNVPFFMDEEDEVPQYHNAPQRQRQAPVNPQRFQQPSANARQQPTQKHPQPAKRNVPHRAQKKNPVKARPKMPDLETCHRSAAKIQKVFRGYQVRKLQMIPKLKQLSKVEQEFKLLNMKFHHVTEVLQQLWTKNIEELDLINYRITHKKLLECEEEMTKKLISLDAISSGQSQFIRTTRKQIVESITIALQQLEPIKKASVQKLQQLQEYHAKLEQQKLDEQARQQEVQKANTTAELDPEELPGNPFFSSEDEASSEGPETVATVFEPMEEQSDEEASEEMAIENSKNESESHRSMNVYDLATLASMGYEAIQQLLERQSRLLQDKDNTIKELQARIEQLEQRTPAAATL